ncbi:MAG: ribonuclease HII [Patescibacteria group bacterium]
MKKDPLPTFQYEEDLWRKKYLVIGIDEVGRGALAGPVGVGAVCFDSAKVDRLSTMGINDSKKLNAAQRELISYGIKESILSSAVTYSSVEVINSKGIVPAVNIAIRQAVGKIIAELDTKLKIFLLLDAFLVKDIPGVKIGNQKAIIKGDGISTTIAAASILAKVHRDNVMKELSKKHSLYMWEKNKGYGTQDHLKAIRTYGPSQFHRLLYIRKVMKQIDRSS